MKCYSVSAGFWALLVLCVYSCVVGTSAVCSTWAHPHLYLSVWFNKWCLGKGLQQHSFNSEFRRPVSILSREESYPTTVTSIYHRFRSIGLRKYGINSLRSLFVSLIPPAVFIAVMAIQLRYFNPLRQEVSSQRTAIETEGGEEGTDSGGLYWFSVFTHNKQLSGTAGPDSVSRTSSVASAVAREKSVSYFYQLPPYLWKKSKQIMCQIVQISWRFLELHLHKFSMVVLFWVVLSEVSAGYWVLLGVSLMVIPLPYFNKIMYPLLTLYIGLLLVIKTTYQYPIVAQYMFNLTTLNGTDDGGQCSGILVSTLV